MKSNLLIGLLLLLSLRCTNINVNPSGESTSKANSKLVSYKDKVGVILGDIPWKSEVLLEDGTVIQPVTNINPGYVHDSTFYKLNPGTVVSLTFDVYPSCDDKGCTPTDLHQQALVILKGFFVLDQSQFNPRKDPIDPHDFKNILTRNDYFLAYSQCSSDTSYFGARTIFASNEFQIQRFLPDNRVISSGTFSITEPGTIKITQTHINSSLAPINPNRLLNGEYNYFHYSIDNLSEDLSTSTVKHHPTDNIIFWKFEGHVFLAYRLEAQIKW